VEKNLARIRAHTQLPVAVGFGIKDAQSAAEVSTIADAVVVGSAIIKKVEENLQSREKIVNSITALLSQMKKAMDLRANQ